MKPLFKSSTIWANLGVMGLPLALEFLPELKQAICTGQNAYVLTVIGMLNIFLRLKTKEPVQMTKQEKSILSILLLAIFLCGCSSIPQKLDPDKFYKRDLPFCVKDIGCYEGTAVLPKKDYYEFEVAPKGDAAVDMLVLNTCHREFTVEGSERSILDYFLKVFGKKREGYKLHYTLIPGIEDDGDCTIRINTFEKDKGRHAWAVFRLQHPKYTLPATVYCNGETRKEVGVSICQSKAGLTQQIKFEEPVMIETDKGCELPKRKETGLYEWKISHGECGYTIRTESGQYHDMLTIGFEGLLVRELK